MAFPTVNEVVETQAGGLTYTQQINLPSTIYSGGLILVMATWVGHGVATPPVIDGFTVLSADNNSWEGGAIWGRVADETEGATTTITFDVDWGNSVSAAAVSISGVNGGLVSGTDYNAETTQWGGPNGQPASVTAGWGADDNLFLAFDGRNNIDASLTSYPSTYVDNRITGAQTATSPNSEMGFATANLAVASSNPDPFVWSGDWTDNVIHVVVRPGSSGGPGPSGPSIQVYNSGAWQPATSSVYDGTVWQPAPATIYNP